MDVTKKNELYDRAETLISRVYAMPTEERETFLETACAGDESLRREVTWLLDVLRSPDDGDFLASNPLIDALSVEGDLHVPQPRHYSLIRQLGEGGMGVVHLAERIEGEFRHTVALKQLNFFALKDPAVLARFVAERQILARLNHPNISHLVDAGALSDGRPFLAMEYVDGERIDDYCHENQLSVAQILNLFLKVCTAVTYAHQQLIIHRDIKPANVLVTGEGEPKLLDFGIARLVAAPGTLVTATVDAARVMTLAFASPEQIEGRSLSTATDQYSLALLLYLLLTGTHPWGDVADPAQIISAVSRSLPIAPSQVVRGQRTGETSGGARAFRLLKRPTRALPKDLDAIVLKALRKDPQDRYPSVAALADDITSFLQGRPVKARKAHAWYWSRKFILRNKLGVAIAAGIFVLTLAFAIDRQLNLEQAQRERSRAQATVELMTSMFGSADPVVSTQVTVTAGDVLDRAAESLASEESMQPPDIRAALLLAVGNAYKGLNLNDQAKKAFDESLRLVNTEKNIDAELKVDVLATVGDFRVSAYRDAQGAQLAAEALELAKKSLPVGNPVRNRALRNRADSIQDSQKEANAESIQLQREAVQEALQKKDTNGKQLFVAEQSLASTLIAGGKLAEADAMFASILPEIEKTNGANSPFVLLTRNEYARTLLLEGKLAPAEVLVMDTLRRAEVHFGSDNPALSTYLNSVADFGLRAGKSEVAADAMTRAVALQTKKLGEDNPARAQLVCNLALALLRADRQDEAEAPAQECVRLRFLPQSKLSGYYRGHALFVLASVEEARGNWADALKQIISSEREIASDPGRNGPDLYNFVLSKAINLSLHEGNLEIANAFVAKAEKQPKGADPGQTDARLQFLRAKIASMSHDSAHVSMFLKAAWGSLKSVKTGCTKLVTLFDEFARAHPDELTSFTRPPDSDLPCMLEAKTK